MEMVNEMTGKLIANEINDYIDGKCRYCGRITKNDNVVCSKCNNIVGYSNNGK